MKIYITSIIPQSLTKKLNNFVDLFGNPEEKIKYELCSKEFGIYIIENDTVSHIESTFEPEYELIKNYNNVDLLVDKTIYKEVQVISQLPVQYICSVYHELKFKIHKKSTLSLIIECVEEQINFEKTFIPINFYFDYEDLNLDLNEPFFQENFNGFLSHLN
jgi:hypothetical protein